MGSLDLFISDPLIVDLGLFGAWLEGLRVEEAVGYEGVSPDEALQELVLADCSDQFRLFWMLQPYFMDPTQPAFQRRYRMLPAMRRLVLDAYYGFDERVMRELLGRKPAPKLRREIEGLREKLNVSQRSVRRQFDNLQRCYATLEEWESAGDSVHGGTAWRDEHARGRGGAAADVTGAAFLDSGAHGGGGRAAALAAHLCESFLFSEAVALRYVHISFLCLHLFETQKRRVLFLTFTDWEAFAALLLEAWTSPASGLELDPQLTATLRHLKGHMADARLSAIMLSPVQAALEPAWLQASAPRAASELKELASRAGGKLKAFVKRLSELAGCLANAKDLKDLFLELVEVAEWLRALTLSAEEASALLDLVAHMLPKAHFSPKQIACWQRFMRGISSCMLLMYARVPVTSLIFLGQQHLGRNAVSAPDIARAQSL